MWLKTIGSAVQVQKSWAEGGRMDATKNTMKLQDPTDRSGRGRQDRDTTKKITILKEGT